MTTAVPDFYTLIHKSLRLVLSEFLIRLGSCDGTRGEDIQRIVVEWRYLRRILTNHSHHEAAHIHPLLRGAAVDLAATLDADHAQLEAQVAAIDDRLESLAGDDAADHPRKLHLAYHAFSLFVADYFRHLVTEETEAMPVLRAHFDAAELFAVHSRVVRQSPPEERLADLPAFIRSLNPMERIHLLRVTRLSAPPPVYAEALRIAEQSLGPESFRATLKSLIVEDVASDPAT